jgi:DNA-binding MarR family transcriptional regulator
MMRADPGTSLADAMADSIRILLRTFTIDERRFPAAAGQMRYNAVDFQTLHFVSAHPGCKSAELAAFLGLTPTTAQSVIDRLIKQDLIERGPHPTNKRAVSLALTTKGTGMCTAIIAQDRINCQTMLAALPTEVRPDFVEQLGQIARAFEREGASR